MAESQKGGRRGVDAADLQTGNVDGGKQYFNGAGKCARAIRPPATWPASPRALRG